MTWIEETVELHCFRCGKALINFQRPLGNNIYKQALEKKLAFKSEFEMEDLEKTPESHNKI